MQRVVRSSLVGLLALAGLAACGSSGQDSTPVGPGASTVVHSVTVSPSSLPLVVGGTGTLAASVDADAGVTDRTVKWTSGDVTVATVDATGKVVGVKAGNTTITAASNANASVSGAASVTVTAAGGGTGAIPTVTISSINQTTGAGSVPVNLGNVIGQIDVTLNVDTNGGILKTVTATIKCGNDSLIQTQTVSNLAPITAAAAASPVTLSFNTAAFSPAGVAALHNGACTISANATTATGTQSATNSTTFTLNNADVIVGSVTYGTTATDAAGLAWVGKSVTVAVTPVFYTTGRTAATTNITLNTPASAVPAHTQTLTDTGTNKSTQTVTFADGNDGKNTATTAIDQITDLNASITVSTIDSNGQPFANAGNVLVSSVANPLAPTLIPNFRLDTQKPVAGRISIANNANQGTSAGGYINGGFRFAADSASGYCGPNSVGYTPGNAGTTTPICTPNTAGTAGVAAVTANLDNASGVAGVDKVTVTFTTRLASAAASTAVPATNPAALAESQTGATYTLAMITTDALGNADTTSAGTFGVDLTAPSSFASIQTSGPANGTTYKATGANAGGPNVGGQQYTNSPVQDNLSGPALLLVAQTRLSTGSGTTASTFEGKTYTNTAAAGTTDVSVGVAAKSPCIVGRFNAALANAGANALTVSTPAGAIFGYCTPVFFAGASVAPDQAAVYGGASIDGYYTTEIITADQAGNRSTPFIATIAADANGPNVTAVDPPGTITAGSQVTFSAIGTDSVDVVASYAAVYYLAANTSLRFVRTPAAGVAFDNTLTRSTPLAPVINSFIRSLAPATAGTPASSGNALVGGAAPDNATSFDIGAVDEVNNSNFVTVSLATTALGTETRTSFDSTNFTAGFKVVVDSATITNCPVAGFNQTTGCGPAGRTTAVHPTAMNLTASASGKTATFANPFTLVTFWRQLPTGDYVAIGSTTAATVTDTGAGNGRTWSYVFNYDPPAKDEYGNNLAPANGATIPVSFIAVGVNASFDAVVTVPITVTLSNP